MVDQVHVNKWQKQPNNNKKKKLQLCKKKTVYKEGLQIKGSVAPKLVRVTVCCVINASPVIFTASDAATASDEY